MGGDAAYMYSTFWLVKYLKICTVHLFRLSLKKCTVHIFFEVSMVHLNHLKESVHVHFSGIKSSSLKMYMVHFEVQPGKCTCTCFTLLLFTSHEQQGFQRISENKMEYDGIRWNMVKQGCSSHTIYAHVQTCPPPRPPKKQSIHGIAGNTSL